MTTVEKLHRASVEFTTERFMSDFWGTRFLFPNRKEAVKAFKATGLDPRKRRDGQYHLELY
jgi:hypothetical protein